MVYRAYSKNTPIMKANELKGDLMEIYSDVQKVWYLMQNRFGCWKW